VWNLATAERPNYVTRLGRSCAFLAVLGAGLIVTTALAGFGTFGRHNIALGVAGEIVALLVNIATYIGVFRVLTAKVVRTRKLLAGAVFGGVAWTILQAVGRLSRRTRLEERQHHLRDLRCRARSDRLALPRLPRHDLCGRTQYRARPSPLAAQYGPAGFDPRVPRRMVFNPGQGSKDRGRVTADKAALRLGPGDRTGAQPGLAKSIEAGATGK
jgi:hypothetical protein